MIEKEKFLAQCKEWDVSPQVVTKHTVETCSQYRLLQLLLI